MTKYLIAYIRVIADRTGVKMKDDTVYFGGVADTLEDAEQQARDCVKGVRTNGVTGTVLPKVFRWPEEPGTMLVDAMYEAQERFEAIVARMNEAHEAITRR